VGGSAVDPKYVLSNADGGPVGSGTLTLSARDGSQLLAGVTEGVVGSLITGTLVPAFTIAGAYDASGAFAISGVNAGMADVAITGGSAGTSVTVQVAGWAVNISQPSVSPGTLTYTVASTAATSLAIADGLPSGQSYLVSAPAVTSLMLPDSPAGSAPVTTGLAAWTTLTHVPTSLYGATPSLLLTYAPLNLAAVAAWLNLIANGGGGAYASLSGTLDVSSGASQATWTKQMNTDFAAASITGTGGWTISYRA